MSSDRALDQLLDYYKQTWPGYFWLAPSSSPLVCPLS